MSLNHVIVHSTTSESLGKTVFAFLFFGALYAVKSSDDV